MKNNDNLRELTIADLMAVRCGGGAEDDCDTVGSKGKAKAKVRSSEGEEYENCKGTITGDGVVGVGGIGGLPTTLPSFP